MTNRKKFIIVFFLFLAIVIGFVIHMASQTTPPWEKRKDSFNKYKIDRFEKRLKKDTIKK